MRSTPRRTTFLRLVLGAAALAFGWLLLSMTQASADDGGTPLASVVTLAKDTPPPRTADVVEPVKAATRTVEKAAATAPLAPVLSAPVTRAAAVVRTSTAAVSVGVDTAVSEAVDRVAAVADAALPAAPAVPTLPTVPAVPGSTTTGASPSPTPAVRTAVEDAVSLGHAARELASVARTAGPASQQTAATTSPSVRSGSQAAVPDPVSPRLPTPGAPAAVTFPAPATASGGSPRSVDAAALSSAAVSPRTTPLRADGALLHPVPGPVSDPGSRPD